MAMVADVHERGADSPHADTVSAAAHTIMQPVVDILARALVNWLRALRPWAAAVAAAADRMMELMIQYAEQVGRQVAPAMKATAEAEAARNQTGQAATYVRGAQP